MKTTLSIIVILLLSACHSFAQAGKTRYIVNQQHLWGSATAALDINPRWMLHLELQERRAEIGEDIQQHLSRVGLMRRLDDKHLLGGGYAFVHTAAYGELPAKFPFDEHRVWLQFQSKEQLKSFGLTHRLRFEFRHLDPARTSRNEFRFRYYFRLQHPLIKGEKHQLYGVLQDEVFVNMGVKVAYNFFDQNRASAMLGYKVNKHLSIEAGYLNQYLLQRSLNADYQNKIENNHTALLALTWSGSLRKPAQQPTDTEKK
jgi:hypothetical protein